MASVPSLVMTFYAVTASAAYVLVIMTNGFIIKVNLSDWSKGRSWMPSDEILSSLVLSNLCHSTALITNYCCSLLLEEFYGTFYDVQRITIALEMSTSFASFWFTAWLSVFYCMKIVSFKQPCLLKMKLKFPGLVRWLLLGSTVLSLGVTLLFQWSFKVSSRWIPVMGLTNQTTCLPPASNCSCSYVRAVILRTFSIYKVLIIILGCSVPLMVVASSSVRVLCSLSRHTQKLEQTLPPSQLEAHVKAAKAVLSLLLCCIISFVCQTVVIAEIYDTWHYEYFLCLMVQLGTLWAQSAILIRSNSRLKQTAARLLSCPLGRHRKRNGQRPAALQEAQRQDPQNASVRVGLA
ncbi:taste receptor type 2 member 40-like [Paroedura picta]|uniref:taste receptor type 2 member 40-like n=1 Tax=Paroedura picta TaxID=143630 RepID=UPI004057A308